MKNRVSFGVTFLGMVFCLLISAVSTVFVPFIANKNADTERIWTLLVGGLFWGGLFLALVIVIILSKMRAKLENGEGAENKKKNRMIPPLCFFSNLIATVFDLLFVVSVAAVVVTQFVGGMNQSIVISSMFFAIFSFEMHCVFNGKNYIFLLKGFESRSILGRASV